MKRTPLSPEQRERIARIFGDVSELPEGERAAYLAAQCGEDEAVHREVAALLASHQEGTLRGLETGGLLPPETSIDGVPEVVGPYRLIHPLGSGGFGTVWLAQQEEPVRRQVAIKLIKPGMDTAEVLARFERERETLAQLDHVNIARILDAGRTDQGRPFFALEYVEGSRVTDFCDEQRLSIEARLALFTDVCAGVHHAHQKGVIHRDLKPSNVLVKFQDGSPQVRVIDFGIARALADDADEQLTRPAAVIGTPAYMSPEQAVRGAAVDTRTDVYSLGVLLFELLTGSLPFETTATNQYGAQDLQKLISERDPITPSSRVSPRTTGSNAIADRRSTTPARLSRALKRELDWIVLKALAPDRERRYPSVSEFAEDVRRYLRQEPVSAGPPSAAYKIRKFVQRHRVGVVAAAAVFTVTVAALVGVSLALQRALSAEQVARDEGTRAQNEASRADNLNKFLVDDILGSARMDRRGKDVTVVDAIASGLPALEQRFAGQPLQHAVILATIADVYNGLGLPEEAIARLRTALKLADEARAPTDSDDVLSIQGMLGQSLIILNRLDEAEPILRKAYALAQTRAAAPDDLSLSLGHALGEALQKLGRHSEAEPLLRKVLNERRTLFTTGHKDYAAVLSSLGACLKAQEKKAEAAEVFGELYEIATKSFPPTHSARLAALNNYAATVFDQGDYPRAAVLYRELTEIVEQALPQGHWQIGLVRFSHGRALCRVERIDEGMQEMTAGLEILQSAFGPTHYLVEFSVGRLATVSAAAGRAEDAIRYRRLATETRFMAAANDQRATLLAAVDTYVAVLTAQGQSTEDAAARVWSELEACAAAAVDSKAPEAPRLARNLGVGFLDAGHFDQAQRWLRRCIELAEAARDGEMVRDAAELMVKMFEATGRPDEASEWRNKAVAGAESPARP